MKKKWLILGAAGITALAGGVLAACLLNETYTLNSNEITVELGDTLDTDISTYVDCSERIKDDVKIDVSNVNTMKVGSYTATVTYKKDSMDFTVNVEDTTAPTVYLANNGTFKTMVGETLAKDDIVSQMDDLAGIERYYILGESDSSENENVSYAEEGDYSGKIVAVDNNGNNTEKEFSVHVVPDYLTHVSGFHDWTVEQSADIDFTQGIEADERIASVTTGSIDTSQIGEQTLVYSITGDDNETVIEQSVTVTVVDAATAQTMANNGETVYVSGNATKAKEVQETKPTTTTTQNNSSTINAGENDASVTSSGNSNTSSTNDTQVNEASSSDGESHWYDSIEPGTTFELGEPVASGEFADGTWYEYDIP